MKKLLLTALLVFAGTAGFAQKMKVQVDKESGTITVNEVPQAILIKENAPGQLGINKNFTITNLDGKELLYFVFTQEPETIILSTTNDMSTDNRVHKVAMLLMQLGFDVHWVGRGCIQI